MLILTDLCSEMSNFADEKPKTPMHTLSPIEIIDKYYSDNEPLRALLLHHSRQVLSKAIHVCDSHPELKLDRKLVEEGSMLHDVGIFLCDAPRIHCHGTYHYLYHGVAGARLMRELGREDIARICERHTGTGLTDESFLSRGLVPPGGILAPQTLEEKVISYADKFFSKSHPERERTVEETMQSLRKFGEKDTKTFLEWVKMFG